MFREGELIVRLGIESHRIRTVDITSTRAPLPARLTQGRPADEVARTIPLLFSICARAQAAAAGGALAAARGHVIDSEQAERESANVRRETVVELLTRLLIDWPKVLGAAPDVASVARARQSPSAQALATCREIAREHIFGTEASRWLAESSAATVERWSADGATLSARLLQQLRVEAEDLGCSDVDTMPAATLQDICGVLPAPGADAEFSRVPQWLGRPVEAGPLARRSHHRLVSEFVERYGNSVAARFLAQLVDLASWLSPNGGVSPAAQQITVAPGIGLGLAETARGILLHQAAVSDGRVQHYSIVAPTEWNFHPSGALARGLAGRSVKDAAAARRDAALLVQALDPCVACTIEVDDA